MLKLVALLGLMAAPLVAQQWTLGTAADPCVGGTAFKIPSTGATVRYGDFTCIFPVGVTCMRKVQLDFIEPCQVAGDCSVLVTKRGQRVQHVFVQDQPAVWNYDIAVAGLPSSSRTVFSFSADGKIIVRVQTVLRAAVLAGVTISQPTVAPPVTARACVGSGPGWDCNELQLWTWKGAQYAVVPATAPMLAIPDCPAAVPCWTTAP